MSKSKASSIFDLDEFRPYQQRFMARAKELMRRRGYYDGSIYTRQRKRWMNLGGPRLYKGIKPLYLPLSRSVNIDAGIIPGGWKLGEDAPKVWEAGIQQVDRWSDWETDGILYVRYGAQYGVSALKIVDHAESGRVMIKPVDPCCLLLVETSPYDKAPRLALWVEQRDDETGCYEYAEVITPTDIRTFRDGEAHAFYGEAPEYPNDLGFVPYVETEHIRTGEPYGECTYQQAIPLLDEVNELASYLADIIRKNAEPQWLIVGAEASDLEKSGDTTWFVPMGGDAKALVAQVNIAGVLAFVQEIRDQVVSSLPELAFDELKSKAQIATATLELQLMELVLKVKASRPNYDHGRADALRMAARAAETMPSTPEITSVRALNDEMLAFDQERPVLPLDKETLLRLEAMEKSLKQMDTTEASEGRQPGQRTPDIEEAHDDEQDDQ